MDRERARLTQLTKRFNDILHGRIAVDPRNSRHFLEALCLQKDPVKSAENLISNAPGLPAIQNAMRFDLSLPFLNGLATDTLEYLVRVQDLGGGILDHILFAIVDPPIFWSAFARAFETGTLAEKAQLVFARVLDRLIVLKDKDSSPYRELASKVLKKLLEFPQPEVRHIASHIKHVLATFASGSAVNDACGPESFEIACRDITSLGFSPDRPYIVAGDSSGFLHQWSADDGTRVNLPAMKSSGRINVVAVSADGRWIISGGVGNKIIIWSTVTQECVIEVSEHTTDAVSALDISSDSTRFAFGSTDCTVQILEVTTGVKLVPPLRHKSRVVDVKFSPDSSQIATATHPISDSESDYPFVAVFNTSGSKLFETPIDIEGLSDVRLAWSSDSQQLFIASPYDIVCVDTSTSFLGWDIGYSDNYRQVSIVTSAKFIVYSSGSLLSFWDHVSRDQIGRVINHAMLITCIAISHDGKRLACGHDEGITVYNLEGFIPENYLPGIFYLPLTRVSAAVLKSWVRGNPTEAEAILSEEITQGSKRTHDTLAICALVRTHLGEWRTAMKTAETSLQIKPSLIGRIARSIALVAAGEQEVVLNELDLVFHDCEQSDIKLLLVVNSILLFVCNKRKDAISRFRRFIDARDSKMKDTYLQVLGMMYLKQGDYANAVETLAIVENPFTTEDRGPLMTLFIIFDWNFENLRFIAWQRGCERLYATGSMKEVREMLPKMISSLCEGERELTYCRILQEIITRSGEVIPLAWTGKPSTCNSCLPSSPAAYTQASTVPLSLTCEEELQKRVADLRTIFPLMDALTTYISVTRSQPVRFAHFRLHLPCIVFRVRTLRKDSEKVYHAETVGLGDVEFTTGDLVALNQPQKLVFVNPWIDHLQEPRSGIKGEYEQESNGELDAQVWSSAAVDMNMGVHGPIIEEVPTQPSRTLDMDVHARALELIVRLGQPFSALLLFKQPDGAYRRVAADHEIVVRGIEDNALKDMRVEVLEVV